MSVRPCRVCGKPATRRLSPDLDIDGVPVCDDETCLMAVWVELFEGLRKMEKEEA